MGKALSDKVKKQKQRHADNLRMQAALDAYQIEQEKPEGVPRRGARPLAAEHSVQWWTLIRLANGKRSMSAFSQSQQRLTPAQEQALVDFAIESADHGFPKAHVQLIAEANAIYDTHKGTESDPKEDKRLGEGWLQCFLSRWHDELQTSWSRPLDTQRAQGLNPSNVKHWLEVLVKEQIVDKEIRPEDTYGMDESGFPLANQG